MLSPWQGFRSWSSGAGAAREGKRNIPKVMRDLAYMLDVDFLQAIGVFVVIFGFRVRGRFYIPVGIHNH